MLGTLMVVFANCVIWSEHGECEQNPAYMNINCKDWCIRAHQIAEYSEKLCSGIAEVDDIGVPNLPTSFSIYNELNAPISVKYVENRQRIVYAVVESYSQIEQFTNIGHNWEVYDTLSAKLLDRFSAGLVVVNDCNCSKTKHSKFRFGQENAITTNITVFLNSSSYANLTKWNGETEEILHHHMKPKTYVHTSIRQGEIITVRRKSDGLQLLSYDFKDLVYRKEPRQMASLHRQLEIVYSDIKHETYNLDNYYSAMLAYAPLLNYSAV